MSRIFISYRRADSQGWAGRLGECLTRFFGDVALFYDLDSIVPGDDFVAAIEKALSDAEAVLVLIGPRWLSASFADGRRRLDDPDDLVAIEIEKALAHDARVIPVLLGNAAMPSKAELPSRIAALATKQALELSDTRWEYDCERLAAEIERATSLRRRPAPDGAADSTIRVAEDLSLDGVAAGDVAGVKTDDVGVLSSPVSVEVAKGATVKNSTLGDIVGVSVRKSR
jgi:hypothetical protein